MLYRTEGPVITMLTFKLIFLYAIVFVIAVADTESNWRTVLQANKHWNGYYTHDGGYYKSSLDVHSVNYVSFTAQGTTLDMKVSSVNNETVIFKETSVWNSSSHFIDHMNLEFSGYFSFKGGNYEYKGNVSSDQSTNFGTIILSTPGDIGRRNDITSLRYGLAIGIPVVLSVLLMVASVLILRWGIKKGYLRHVPLAYKHFRNPRRERAEIELSDPDGCNTIGQSEVHI